MSPWLLSVVAVVSLGAAAMHAVIHDVGVGEAMHSVAALAEGQDRRRGHEAKGRKHGDHHRRAEAKPGAECPQYEFKPSA